MPKRRKDFVRLLSNNPKTALVVFFFLLFSFIATSLPGLIRQEDSLKIEMPPKGVISQRGKVVDVIDGDTIEMEGGKRIRYIGINTPEKGQHYYKESREYNESLVLGKEVELELDVQTNDNYGRILAYVWVNDTLVNLALVGSGFANVFTVPPNIKYEKYFSEAEKYAREHNNGLWSRGATLGEVESLVRIENINPKGPDEWVKVKNNSEGAVNIGGWTLSDSANHSYTFPQVVLAKKESVVVYTGFGSNSQAGLYWNNPTPVWNDNGDTAFLRDRLGNLVDMYRY